ncbi:MAG: hypothetical protein GF334_04235 [Candidatus Altiarchaeales archaeon]|nr:hypothetical protein [Candidatus Altiarchaeales archaeon]
MDEKVMQQLLTKMASLQEQLVNNQVREKAISGTPDAQLIFGPNGIFSNFGLEDVVVNASISPKGIAGRIPAMPTVYLNPIYPFITGFESDGGDEVDGVCDDAPGGVIETCHTTAQFGRIARGSKEMEINEMMQILNRRLSTDLRLMGDVIGEGHPLMSSETTPQNWLTSVMLTQLVIIGIQFQRWLVPKLWTGDPTNNSGGGGYKEFPGLDILISTGKVDAFTGVACSALDSDIKDFNFNSVDSSSPSLLTYMSYMDYYLRHIASRTGLDPVEWVIAMRPELFFEITAVWPCQYLTYRCGEDSSGGSLNVINDDNNVSMRDEMRNGNFLWVNGRRLPVVTDDGIFEDNAATNANLIPGEFASDIYFLPVRASNMPVLYWEHLDYSQAMADVGRMGSFDTSTRFWSTDGGRYMWTAQSLNYCFKIQGKMEPRLVLRTPHLAGRIQNVKYSPLQHLRSWDEDSPYFYKGGKEEYTDPTFYSEWNQQL